MTRRKRYNGPTHPEWWEVSQVYRHGRQELRRGTPLKIKDGGRGAIYKFWDYVLVPAHDGKPPVEWITVTGGTRESQSFRSFRPDRISRVLRPRPERKRSR